MSSNGAAIGTFIAAAQQRDIPEHVLDAARL